MGSSLERVIVDVCSMRELKALVGSARWAERAGCLGARGVYSVTDRRSGQVYVGSGGLQFAFEYHASTGHAGKPPLIRVWGDAPPADDDLEFAMTGSHARECPQLLSRSARASLAERARARRNQPLPEPRRHLIKYYEITGAGSGRRFAAMLT